MDAAAWCSKRHFKPKAWGKHYLRATCDLVEDFGTSYEVLVTAR